MSVGVPVVPMGTMGLRCPDQRVGRRQGSSPVAPPRPPPRPVTRIPPGGSPCRARSASNSGLSGLGAVGVKLLTRMPYGARSIAAARTKLLTPPLWNAYATTPGVPDQPLDDEMQTIEPLMPRSAIARPTCLVLRKFPSADTRTARSKSAAVSSSTPRPPSSAALFTRMSMRPHRASTSLTYPWTAASSVTSPGAAIASPPLRSIRAMQALIDASSRSLQATFAPYRASASAMPLPMFGPTPVTSATLPARETSTVTAPSLGRYRLDRYRMTSPGGPAERPEDHRHGRVRSTRDDDRNGFRRREHGERPVADVLSLARGGHLSGIPHRVLEQPLLNVSAAVSGVAEQLRVLGTEHQTAAGMRAADISAHASQGVRKIGQHRLGAIGGPVVDVLDGADQHRRHRVAARGYAADRAERLPRGHLLVLANADRPPAWQALRRLLELLRPDAVAVADHQPDCPR